MNSEKKKDGIQKSLEAEVTVYVNEELQKTLEKLEDELRFIFITSEAKVKPLGGAVDAVPTDIDGLLVQAVKTKYAKCERCWHHREDVGSHAKYVDICSRCIENIDGQGEQRLYA